MKKVCNAGTTNSCFSAVLKKHFLHRLIIYLLWLCGSFSVVSVIPTLLIPRLKRILILSLSPLLLSLSGWLRASCRSLSTPSFSFCRSGLLGFSLRLSLIRIIVVNRTQHCNPTSDVTLCPSLLSTSLFQTTSPPLVSQLPSQTTSPLLP